MKDTILNMTLAEDGIVVLALVLGGVVGWLIAIIRHWRLDMKFKKEEKAIKRKISSLSISELADMAEDKKFSMQAPVRSMLRKILEEIEEAEQESDSEDDNFILSGLIYDLSRLVGKEV